MSLKNDADINIVVCIKQIIDPQTPAAEFQINPEAKRALLPGGRKLVISDYDEVAVEAALKIQDARPCKITVLSLGEKSAMESLRHCIAMGADDGILLTDPLFDDSDSFATAQALAQAIKKSGNFDLIFCGSQEGDWDAGQVGTGIAHFLNIPVVTMAKSIEIRGDILIVERITADGYETFEIEPPALVTVSSEIGKPRYPPFRRIRAASRKEITTWDAQSIDYSASARNKILKLFIPVYDGQCSYIEGDTPEKMGDNLALKLKERHLI